MKILNLYAGIGGNRKLWGGAHTITAVEIDPAIARVYKDLYPADDVVVGDAHQYLLDHHQDFDFIWSSPPCPTHSQLRYNLGFKANRKYAKVKATYADMTLYQKIILLNYYYRGKWLVENTIPYYKPLVPGVISANHIWWANFVIPAIPQPAGGRGHRDGTVESLQLRKQTDLSKYDIPGKRKLLRNAVEPETGLAMLEASLVESVQGTLL